MLTRIVKVGGSLLTWPPLADALRTWLARQPPALNVLLPGGGTLVDVIRRADRDLSLGDEAAHWRCVDLLSVTARWLTAKLGDVPLLETHDELLFCRNARQRARVVFDVREWLQRHEPSGAGRRLPHDWSVTSDSIAARLAEVIGADELVILKSADPPAESVAKLAIAGYIDRHFPPAAAALAVVRFVNLRG